jgi:hypothetical protein
MEQDTSAQQGEDTTATAEDEVDPREKYRDILDPLREKHGGEKKIQYWEVPDFGLVVATKPENYAAEIARLQNLLRNEDADPMPALRTFALKCVVHPDRDTARRIFDALPLFVSQVAIAGQRFCGSGIKALGKA